VEAAPAKGHLRQPVEVHAAGGGRVARSRDGRRDASGGGVLGTSRELFRPACCLGGIAEARRIQPLCTRALALTSAYCRVHSSVPRATFYRCDDRFELSNCPLRIATAQRCQPVDTIGLRRQAPSVQIVSCLDWQWISRADCLAAYSNACLRVEGVQLRSPSLLPCGIVRRVESRGILPRCQRALSSAAIWHSKVVSCDLPCLSTMRCASTLLRSTSLRSWAGWICGRARFLLYSLAHARAVSTATTGIGTSRSSARKASDAFGGALVWMLPQGTGRPEDVRTQNMSDRAAS
jgi:hypothetical protein